jgi:hypothetical protein
MNTLHRWFLIGTALFLSACSSIHTRNVDGVEGVMLGGYDAVSYFEQPAPMRGVSALQAKGKYGIYFFANEQNKAKFVAAPEKFEPQFGGHCADGIAYDLKTPGNPLVYEVANSKSRGGPKLLMFGGKTAKIYWQIHRAQQWHRADKYWAQGLDAQPSMLHNYYRWTIGKVPHYLTTAQVNEVLKDAGENPSPFCDCE